MFAGDTELGVLLAAPRRDGAPPHLQVAEDAIKMGSYGRVLTLLVIR